MSENTTTKIRPPKRSTTGAAPEQTYGLLFEGNRQAFERWFHGMLELSQEVLQFTQARLHEDAAAWAQLAAMRNLEEVLQFQQHFAERITKEYLEEFNRLSHIVADMADRRAAPQQQSDTRAETVGKAA